MKLKLFYSMLCILVCSSCNPKNEAIESELILIEKTAKDNAQSKYIRKSAETFREILSEKKGIPRDNLSDAQWEMVSIRNATTIKTNLAFLTAVAKQFPKKLPTVEVYESMSSKAGKATTIEYNVALTVIMMSNSIKNISLYGDPAADAEINGVLKRLKEKHGTSETGKKILDLLTIEQEQGLTARSWGIKPWESPRRTPGESR